MHGLTPSFITEIQTWDLLDFNNSVCVCWGGASVLGVLTGISRLLLHSATIPFPVYRTYRILSAFILIGTIHTISWFPRFKIKPKIKFMPWCVLFHCVVTRCELLQTKFSRYYTHNINLVRSGSSILSIGAYN